MTSFYTAALLDAAGGYPKPGQAYFTGSRHISICRSFGVAIFVGSDETVPLNEQVLACIKCAHDNGLTSLAMPDFCCPPRGTFFSTSEDMKLFVQGFNDAKTQNLLIPRIFVAIGARTTGYATSLEQALLRI